MRLINTETLEMHEFLPAHIPRYAILSHRWQDEEVSFKQYSKRHKYAEIRQLKGFAKIEQFCRIARERQMEWAWIDTCCIDSRSSAELSEAINSMWQWYADAAECYIYLCDVHMQDNFSDVLAQVERSKWFTRGWTLQELIAPRHRVFFSSAWMEVGLIQFGMVLPIATDDEDFLSSFPHFISRASKVPLRYLLDHSVFSCNVGERISWSANRETSRPEDVAYSLMGLLDVNMPLLYGEGKARAFIRLQLELIKKSRDTSLFAWEISFRENKTSERHGRGLLASSPTGFANFSRIPSHSDDYWSFRMIAKEFSLVPYEMTNRGLHLHVGAYRILPHSLSSTRVWWCVPLSMDGSAIFLIHSARGNPMCSPVSATRTSLIGWETFNVNGMFRLEGARKAVSWAEDLDAGRSVVYLAEDQRGKLELCDFYVGQDYL